MFGDLGSRMPVSSMNARSYKRYTDDDPNPTCLLKFCSPVDKKTRKMKFCSNAISSFLSPPATVTASSSSTSASPFSSRHSHKYPAPCTDLYTLYTLIILLRYFTPITLGDLWRQGDFTHIYMSSTWHHPWHRAVFQHEFARMGRRTDGCTVAGSQAVQQYRTADVKPGSSHATSLNCFNFPQK